MTEDTYFQSTSGAYIGRFGNYVVKTGQDRVGARIDSQAAWLVENAGPNVVRVVARMPGMLIMPRLMEWSGMTPPYVVHTEVASALETVWARDAVVLEPNPREMLAHLARIARYFGNDVAEYASELDFQVKWDDLPRCRTHGDPTWCNTMWGPVADALQLIDPLPATERVPDIRAVDLGKLLQSCLGWEEVAHGWNITWVESDLPEEWVRDICIDDNEWLAATFWCLVHLARLVPYFQDNENVMKWVKKVVPHVCGL